MSRIKTFLKGGVHPEKNKFTDNTPIEEMPLPKKVKIPISQHLGAPARPLVKKGDSVKVGQLIATSEGFTSANIHSSVSGRVLSIEPALNVNGYKSQAIFIEVQGDDWDENIDKSPGIIRDAHIKPKDIISRINMMGIVGMGGATFPTFIKMMVPRNKQVDTLLINGAECEPYITADHRVLLEKGEQILVGTSLMMKAINVKKAYIGIETNKQDAIDHLNKFIKNYPGIEIVPLQVKYPQGAEKMLIKAITGKELKSGLLPLDVGCIVQNIGTVNAVYEAIMKNKPLFERVVTVTGKSVLDPKNLRVRIGTSISDLIEHIGGTPNDTGKIISGGSMMGKALYTPDSPIMKGTSAIVFMKESESMRIEQENCIRCSKCVFSCPMGLEPYLLALLAENKEFDRVKDEFVTDCMECGCCQFNCPAGRYLLDYIRVGKKKAFESMRKKL